MGWYEDYGIVDGEVVSVLAAAHVFRESEGMRVGGPPSWSGCNPGNIVAGTFTDTHYGYPGRFIYRFAVFPSDADGKAAIIDLLKTDTYTPLSILDAMAKYAPKGDGTNDPQFYAQQIADGIGKSLDTLVGSLSDEELDLYADKIAFVESHGAPTGDIYSRDQELPSDIVDWLNTYPTADERAAADQPFCTTGNQGPGVQNMQSLLAGLGLLAPEDVIGTFGPKTKAAVQAVQSRNGLGPDGVAGPNTWKAILAETG